MCGPSFFSSVSTPMLDTSLKPDSSTHPCWNVSHVRAKAHSGSTSNSCLCDYPCAFSPSWLHSRREKRTLWKNWRKRISLSLLQTYNYNTAHKRNDFHAIQSAHIKNLGRRGHDHDSLSPPTFTLALLLCLGLVLAGSHTALYSNLCLNWLHLSRF